MDTSWMYLKDRTLPQYIESLEFFLDSIYSDVGPNECKKCPCARCYGRFYSKRDHVKDDLIVNGFMENYLPWSLKHNIGIPHCNNEEHEDVMSNYETDDIVGMVYDATGIQNGGESLNEDGGIMDDETSKVFKMLEDGKQPLYKGCKRFTSLSFMTRLLHIKVLGGWSNKSCSMVMELLHEALTEIGDVVMPKTYYEPFILASQAEQAMYIVDPIDPEWKVAIKMTSRDTFDMGDDENCNITIAVPQAQPYSSQQLDERRNVDEGIEMWARHDVEGTLIERRDTQTPREDSPYKVDSCNEVDSEFDKESQDELEDDVPDGFEEEEFDDTIEVTSDDMGDDAFANMSDDESDDD